MEKSTRSAFAALERALELDGFANPARCARLISLQAMELQFDPDHERRRALVDQALALARDAGDPRTLAYVLRDHFNAFWAPDTLELRRATVGRVRRDMPTKTDDPALEVGRRIARRRYVSRAASWSEAGGAARRLREIAEELGEPNLRWFSRYYDACMALLRGDLVSAERLADEAFKIGNDAGQPDALMIYSGQLTAVPIFQGRVEEIVEMVEDGVEANPRIAVWRAGLAAIYCWLGRKAEGGAIVEEAAKDGFDHVPWDQVRLTTLALYAEAASLAASRMPPPSSTS